MKRPRERESGKNESQSSRESERANLPCDFTNSCERIRRRGIRNDNITRDRREKDKRDRDSVGTRIERTSVPLLPTTMYAKLESFVCKEDDLLAAL